MNVTIWIPSSGVRVSVWRFLLAHGILLKITCTDKQGKIQLSWIPKLLKAWHDRRTYISFSAPLLLLLRLLGSRLGGGVWLALGGFFLISSFLCLSMSSLCPLTFSCCLYKDKVIFFLSFHIVSQCSCGSVVDYCVSSAKGCGFDSQGTHILIKHV